MLVTRPSLLHFRTSDKTGAQVWFFLLPQVDLWSLEVSQRSTIQGSVILGLLITYMHENQEQRRDKQRQQKPVSTSQVNIVHFGIFICLPLV